MKKDGSFSLILATILFAVFTVGFFAGRFSNGQLFPQIVLTDHSPSNSTAAATDPDAVFIDGMLNLNTAAAEDLMLLPGIGEVLAQRIIEYRTVNGPFRTVDELSNVNGIGKTRVTNLIDYITVGG